MNVFLIGMMGSGKSTLGKALSRSLSMECIDLDVYLVEKEQLSISEIFESKGEAFFRERETFYLKELATRKDLIIATGGGAPCFNDNMELMNQLGETIFLDVPQNELFKRLSGQKKGRPLLENKSDEELKTYISETLEKRRVFYEKAKFKLTKENIEVADLVKILNFQK